MVMLEAVPGRCDGRIEGKVGRRAGLADEDPVSGAS